MLSKLQISAIRAREVLDCRGLPTVRVDVVVDDTFLGRADVPAGRSRGRHEPVELRDGGRRFGGYGVRQAVSNVRDMLAPALAGFPVVVLPVPQVNLINGGQHASNDLDIQEIIMMPVGAATFADAMAMATEVNLVLAEILASRYGKAAVNTGDEGGFAPPISEPAEALEQLHLAVARAGYEEQVEYGLDCAASHFYDPDQGVYVLAAKPRNRLLQIEEELGPAAVYAGRSYRHPH